MNLNDYFLVKVFERAEYMESFNSGSIYLNSTSFFWELENSFQQDKEGLVFQQFGKGLMLKTRSGFEKIITELSSVEDIVNRVEKENSGQGICETSYFSVGLNGYICCFYLLPKKDVVFNKNILSITSETTKNDIIFFLERYLDESNTKDFHVSIYDAVTFCNIFFEKMYKNGYKLICGAVKYKDIDEKQRIGLFHEQNYPSIVFTKSTQYSYQKEFRVFLFNSNEQIKEHIIVDECMIGNSLIGSFCYEDISKVNKLTEQEPTSF